MIYSAEKSVAVFLNPKTGTTSLIDCFQNTTFTFDQCIHNHMNVNHFVQRYNPNLSTTKMFCFYREPVDRMLSMWNYVRTTPGHLVKMLNYFYGNQFKISHLNRDSFESLSTEIQDALARIKIIDFLESDFKEKISPNWPLLYPQRDWLAFDNIELLPYSQFSTGVASIASEIGITDYTLNILNEKQSIPNDPTITQEEIDYIKLYSKEDYDFFQFKGISF
jgi:hypothetical protein